MNPSISFGKFRNSLISGIIFSILITSYSSLASEPDSVSILESAPDNQQLPHQQKQSSKNRIKNHVPKIAKIFENPDPNDGYESLREFSEDVSKIMNITQLYNTTIALTSALFSFQLPKNNDTEEMTVTMANQIIFGMFAFLTAVLAFGIPALATGTKFNPSARRNTESAGIFSQILAQEPMASLIKKEMHKKIGLEPEKCLQKTICEAHRAPKNKKYGLLAVPFQIFYPPPSKAEGKNNGGDSFQKAAYVGKYHKTRCGKKYNCFFDVLDLGNYVIDWYQYHNYDTLQQ